MDCLLCSPRVGRVVLGDATDGALRRCTFCGRWWQTRFEGNAPAGFRGQWSGWVDWPVSARRARKLQAVG